MAYYFKTQGREYSFTLEGDGLLHANDLGLSAATLPELAALVKARVKEEKSAPRIPVIILDTRWYHVEGYTFGSASGKADRHGYRWVSYKDGTEEKEKSKRRTFDADRLYLDTPENRERANELLHLGRRINALVEQSKEIRSNMLTVEYYQAAQSETV